VLASFALTCSVGRRSIAQPSTDASIIVAPCSLLQLLQLRQPTYRNALFSMLPIRETLRLYDAPDGEIILIPSWRWHDLRGEGGYQEADRWQALWVLNRLSDFDLMKARGFVTDADLRCPDRLNALPQMGDHEVRSTIIRAIEEHRIIAIRKGAGPTRRTQGKGTSVELRGLVEQVERMGKLAFQGRQYKLVVAGDLPPQTRDTFAVVSPSEARAVLDGLAKESPASADVLGQAAAKIAKDWRPSLSTPEGLVLVRLVQARDFATKDEEPAVTPPQRKGGPSDALAAPPVEDETCRPCAALREAKQAEALTQASQDGSPFCADCGPAPSAAA
jgi:hypothetical protein